MLPFTRLTPLEEQAWLIAYATRQPRTIDLGFESAAVYWAAEAVFHLRGEKNTPSPHDCQTMFEYMQQKNRNQREDA